MTIPDKPCPASYTTRRNARRMAWYTADRAGVKPLEPVQCERCGGAWHLHPDDPGRAASATELYRRATTPTNGD